MSRETRPYWFAGILAAAAIAAGTLIVLTGGVDSDDAVFCGDAIITYHVYAASSLAEAFEDIRDEQREAQTCSLPVVFNFAGSQELRIQIGEQGGPNVEVFASADRRQLDLAIHDGGIEGEPHLFARNKLVIIVPKDNDAGIESLQDLANDSVKLVVAGEEVPAGAYARAVLENAANDADFGEDYAEAVLDNVVSNEPNVRQVVAKVALGEADAGIVYATDARAGVADELEVLQIPDEFNEAAEYWLARRDDYLWDNVNDFVDFVLSEAGQDILEKHGFIRVDQ